MRLLQQQGTRVCFPYHKDNGLPPFKGGQAWLFPPISFSDIYIYIDYIYIYIFIYLYIYIFFDVVGLFFLDSNVLAVV